MSDLLFPIDTEPPGHHAWIVTLNDGQFSPRCACGFSTPVSAHTRQGAIHALQLHHQDVRALVASEDARRRAIEDRLAASETHEDV